MEGWLGGCIDEYGGLLQILEIDEYTDHSNCLNLDKTRVFTFFSVNPGIFLQASQRSKQLENPGIVIQALQRSKQLETLG